MPDWIPQLPLPMVIDLLFFAAILILLQQMNRKMTRKSRVVDEAVLDQFQALLKESQAATDQFLTVIEKEVRTLQKLIRQLEEKERLLVSLLEAAEIPGERPSGGTGAAERTPQRDRNAEVLSMVREGLSREAIAQRTGMTAGEIDLVVELDRAGQDHR